MVTWKKAAHTSELVIKKKRKEKKWHENHHVISRILHELGANAVRLGLVFYDYIFLYVLRLFFGYLFYVILYKDIR